MLHLERNDKNKRNIYSLIENKNMVETFLSEVLMLIFSENGVLSKKMRDIVKEALIDLNNISKMGNGKGKMLIDKAWENDVKNYKILNKSFLDTIILGQNVARDKTQLTYKPSQKTLGYKEHTITPNAIWVLTEVNYFAEFIRFYGEVVELAKDAEKNLVGDEYSELKAKLSKMYEDKESLKIEPGLHHNGKEYHMWGRPEKGDPQGLRIRESRFKDWGPETEKKYKSSGSFFWSDYIAKTAGGVNVWAEKNGSLFLKMDRVFGLSKGADVSGTTTDTIFFLRKFGKAAYKTDLDPIFYLLPFAMIVAGGHHTLLEVAVPTAVLKKIDYKIGLYSTLMPLGVETNSSYYNIIDDTLKDAENSTLNQHFLVYYDKNDPAGCFIFDKNDFMDRIVWSKIARADEELLQAFLTYQNYPTKENVISLIKNRGKVMGSQLYRNRKPYQETKGISDSERWRYRDEKGQQYRQFEQHVLISKDGKKFERVFEISEQKAPAVRLSDINHQTIGWFKPES